MLRLANTSQQTFKKYSSACVHYDLWSMQVKFFSRQFMFASPFLLEALGYLYKYKIYIRYLESRRRVNLGKQFYKLLVGSMINPQILAALKFSSDVLNDAVCSLLLWHVPTWWFHHLLQRASNVYIICFHVLSFFYDRNSLELLLRQGAGLLYTGEFYNSCIQRKWCLQAALAFCGR